MAVDWKNHAQENNQEDFVSPENQDVFISSSDEETEGTSDPSESSSNGVAWEQITEDEPEITEPQGWANVNDHIAFANKQQSDSDTGESDNVKSDELQQQIDSATTEYEIEGYIRDNSPEPLTMVANRLSRNGSKGDEAIRELARSLGVTEKNLRYNAQYGSLGDLPDDIGQELEWAEESITKMQEKTRAEFKKNGLPKKEASRNGNQTSKKETKKQQPAKTSKPARKYSTSWGDAMDY